MKSKKVQVEEVSFLKLQVLKLRQNLLISKINELQREVDKLQHQLSDMFAQEKEMLESLGIHGILDSFIEPNTLVVVETEDDKSGDKSS